MPHNRNSDFKSNAVKTIVHVDAPDNFIGGVETGTANIIAFNMNAGVLVRTKTGNSIRGNSIYGNAGLGIDLSADIGNPDGVTQNDPKDLDLGGNNLLNYPVLSSALVISNRTSITGRLNTHPDVIGITIDFYDNDACDASGSGEGKTYFGAITVNTDENGDSPFSFILPRALTGGHFITATTTGTGNSTSEFSQCMAVHSPPVLQAGYFAGDLGIAWPAWATRFRLWETDTLNEPIDWRPVSIEPALTGDKYIFTPQFPLTDRFYRLVEIDEQ